MEKQEFLSSHHQKKQKKKEKPAPSEHEKELSDSELCKCLLESAPVLQVFGRVSRCAYTSRGHEMRKEKKDSPEFSSSRLQLQHIKNLSTHIFIIKSHCQQQPEKDDDDGLEWDVCDFVCT